MNSSIRKNKGERLAGIDICTGCGTCYALCPADAIKMKIDSCRGVYYPQIDYDKCIDCGICSDVCPALSLNIGTIARSIFDSGLENAVIGDHERCYLAHATDHDIRYSSASGGLVTALLIFALAEGLIDGALVTRMDPSNPLLPEPFIARTKEDILAASSSKYCPVPANKAIRMLLENEGRFAVVGLPCHMHGIRKAEMSNEDLKRKIGLHLGLFCSHTLNFHATHHLLKRIGMNPGEVVKIEYRGRGWPGGTTIRNMSGNDRFISNQDPLWNAIFGSHFFTPKSCLWCTDLTSELSDLSFGDPWLPEIARDERIGKSIVISRNHRGEDLLRIAREQQRIESEIIDSSVVAASQSVFSYFKKGNIWARYRIGGTARTHSLNGFGKEDCLMGRAVALMTILNCSMGHRQLFRNILGRTPFELLRWYSAMLNWALARSRDKYILVVRREGKSTKK